MKAFKKFTGIVAPLDRANVDTDQIIPKQFLKSIVRSGLGAGLFYDWRNQADSADFVLNQPRFRDASILVARANFGSGSSREHAVWALDDFGFRAVIAPSFADIFFNNCFKNGFLPIVLQAGEVKAEAGNPTADLIAAWLNLRLDIPMRRSVSGGPGITQVSFTTATAAFVPSSLRSKLRPSISGVLAAPKNPGLTIRKFALSGTPPGSPGRPSTSTSYVVTSTVR